MIDYLSEVFVLYHELFEVNLSSSSSNKNAANQSSRQFGLQINGPIVQVLLILPLMRKRTTHTIISMER